MTNNGRGLNFKKNSKKITVKILLYLTLDYKTNFLVQFE